MTSLATRVKTDYLPLFFKSREAMQVSAGTLHFYRVKLGRFLRELDPENFTLAAGENRTSEEAHKTNWWPLGGSIAGLMLFTGVAFGFFKRRKAAK